MTSLVDHAVSSIFGALIASAAFIIHLGTRVSVVEERARAMEKWMDRIEAKLDEVLNGIRRP